jgi:hypothetical protein
MIGPTDLLHPSMMGTESFFIEQSSRSVALTTNPFSNFRVKKEQLYPYPPFWAFIKFIYPSFFCLFSIPKVEAPLLPDLHQITYRREVLRKAQFLHYCLAIPVKYLMLHIH